MRRSDVFPSTYLGKTDIARPTTATIDAVRMETIKGEHGDDDKPVLFFRGDTLKKMILNSGNWDTLEDAYGDSDEWGGRLIEVYVDPNVMYGGKRVGGVRVRVPNASKQPADAKPKLMSFNQAIEAAGKLGLSKDEFIAALKTRGFTSWHPAECAQAAREILAATPPDDGFIPVEDDGTIPF